MYIIFSSVTRRELLVLLVNANFLTYPLAPILSLWPRTRSGLCPPPMLPSVLAVLMSVQTYCYFYRHNKTLSRLLQVPLPFSPSLYNKTHWKRCPYFLTPIFSPTKRAVAHSCEPTAVRLVLLSPHWNVSYQGIPWLPCCWNQRSTLIFLDLLAASDTSDLSLHLEKFLTLTPEHSILLISLQPV